MNHNKKLTDTAHGDQLTLTRELSTKHRAVLLPPLPIYRHNAVGIEGRSRFRRGGSGEARVQSAERRGIPQPRRAIHEP